jgi:hypothetical protein
VQKGFHAWVITGINIFIQDGVEYINVVGVLAPLIQGLRILLKIL